ncbi:molybdate ABC transporter substrate-binding protein [Vibrio hangzhouensis]|uniref:Molybdate transport system substrate-binding protein n=1 Tax=Vibrio hangzhouensis TaxID=462991 RepID=A0A1H5TIB8_9VIBR|nr:molybdate ABC transporter substrate-binding protein [Vibrio hangzhouensis]SEF61851.1 molybdate transport system substrate-binding protein [Vibrio hangzhouensis]
MFKQRISLLVLPFIFGITSNCYAEEVFVAVANNFNRPLLAMTDSFHEATGHQLVISTGSSGQIFSQVKNGAPYDVFLSGDQKRPAALVNESLATGQMTYAEGRIVLWSPIKDLYSDAVTYLQEGKFLHIAIANPKVAPYGVAATQVLETLDLSHKLKPKVVMGKGLNPTYQYVVTGNAELGFLAMSQVIRDGELLPGTYWKIPDSLYEPIKQDAVLLRHGIENPAAKAFMAYLRTPQAKAIIQEFGYR